MIEKNSNLIDETAKIEETESTIKRGTEIENFQHQKDYKIHKNKKEHYRVGKPVQIRRNLLNLGNQKNIFIIGKGLVGLKVCNRRWQNNRIVFSVNFSKPGRTEGRFKKIRDIFTYFDKIIIFKRCG